MTTRLAIRCALVALGVGLPAAAHATLPVRVHVDPRCGDETRARALHEAIALRLPQVRIEASAPDEAGSDALHVRWVPHDAACAIHVHGPGERVVLDDPGDSLGDAAVRIAFLHDLAAALPIDDDDANPPALPPPTPAPVATADARALAQASVAGPDDGGQPRVLVDGVRLRSLYGGIQVEGSALLSTPVLLAGLRGGIGFARGLLLEIEGRGVNTRVPTGTRSELGSPEYLNGGWGTVRIGAEIQPDERIHAYVLAGAGAGALIVQPRVGPPEPTSDDPRGVVVAAFSAEAGVTFNLARFARADVGLAYRQLVPFEAPGFQPYRLVSGDLSHLGVTLSLRFGSFDR